MQDYLQKAAANRSCTISQLLRSWQILTDAAEEPSMRRHRHLVRQRLESAVCAPDALAVFLIWHLEHRPWPARLPWCLTQLSSIIRGFLGGRLAPRFQPTPSVSSVSFCPLPMSRVSAKDLQACDRAHRIGQTRPVLVPWQATCSHARGSLVPSLMACGDRVPYRSCDRFQAVRLMTPTAFDRGLLERSTKKLDIEKKAPSSTESWKP